MEGNQHGQAFRDVQLEQGLLEEAQTVLWCAVLLRLRARHSRYPSATSRRILPVGTRSRSADRNIKAKINREGICIPNWNTTGGQQYSTRTAPGRLRRSGES
ncbi:hypothetical protein ACLK17_25280 [Escherichia coli]